MGGYIPHLARAPAGRRASPYTCRTRTYVDVDIGCCRTSSIVVWACFGGNCCSRFGLFMAVFIMLFMLFMLFMQLARLTLVQQQRCVVVVDTGSAGSAVSAKSSLDTGSPLRLRSRIAVGTHQGVGLVPGPATGSHDMVPQAASRRFRRVAIGTAAVVWVCCEHWQRARSSSSSPR